MTTYHPDLWKIVKLTPVDNTNKTYFRIFATWAGGFARGDSWKLSSGITEIEYQEPCWIVKNHSGSVYHLHKNGEGFTGYSSSVLDQYTKDSAEHVKLEVVDIEEAVNGC